MLVVGMRHFRVRPQSPQDGRRLTWPPCSLAARAVAGPGAGPGLGGPPSLLQAAALPGSGAEEQFEPPRPWGFGSHHSDVMDEFIGSRQKQTRSTLGFCGN